MNDQQAEPTSVNTGMNTGTKTGIEQQGADTSRWMVIPRTLCFIRNGNDVLLMKRSPTRRVFPNRYNGVGGHIERGEDPHSSVLREITEETGIPASAILNLRMRGTYHVDAGGTGIMVFVFTADTATRDVIDTDEGSLHWVPLDGTHALDLVDDLPLVLPRLFGTDSNVESESGVFHATVHYDAENRMIMRFVG
jgi:8-oxo-dGTP diphosphatase